MMIAPTETGLAEVPVEAPAKVTKDRLVEYVTQCWDEGEEVTVDRRGQWNELWDAYQSKQDYSHKARWQSQLFIPKVWVHVTKASLEIRRAMLQTQRLFKLELDDSAERAQISTYRRALAKMTDARQMMLLTQAIRQVDRDLKDQLDQMQLEDARFKSDLTRTNLARVYSEMVIVAFLLGLGIIKVGWQKENRRVIFKHIDPFNFHICPDWEPTSGEDPAWVVERAMMPLADLYESAQQRNDEAGEQVYDVKALNQLQADYVSDDKDQQDRRRGLNPVLRESGKVELLFFWGDIPKEGWRGYEGRNQFVVVANGRVVIRKGANPFNHGKAPYILTMPLTFPFRGHCGSSLVEPIVRANYTYNNIVNLYVDGLNFTVNKQFQCDPTKLRDPRQINRVFPGKIWQVKTGSDNAAVMQEIPVSPMSSDALRAAELLSHDMQESTGVTEYIQGLPSKRVKTLGEMQLKTAESRGLFDVTARDMEQFSLQPLLEMAWDVCVQCADYPPREDHYHVLANGLSTMVAQGELVEAIGSILTLALKSPEIAQRTKINDLYKRFLSIHNLSDCYQEPPDSMAQPLTPEQQDAMATQAEQDARQMVGQMSPEQIMKVAP